VLKNRHNFHRERMYHVWGRLTFKYE
jgi:hypothetical protein